MKNSIRLMFVGLFLFVFFMGCSKLSKENYDKIKVGMDFQQVVKVIGEPDKCDAAIGTKSCIWGTDQKNIKIKFIADKVILPTMKGI